MKLNSKNDPTAFQLAQKAKLEKGVPYWKTFGHAGLGGLMILPIVLCFSLVGSMITALKLPYADALIVWAVLIYFFYRVLKGWWGAMEKTDPTEDHVKYVKPAKAKKLKSGRFHKSGTLRNVIVDGKIVMVDEKNNVVA